MDSKYFKTFFDSLSRSTAASISLRKQELDKKKRLTATISRLSEGFYLYLHQFDQLLALRKILGSVSWFSGGLPWRKFVSKKVPMTFGFVTNSQTAASVKSLATLFAASTAKFHGCATSWITRCRRNPVTVSFAPGNACGRSIQTIRSSGFAIGR